MNPRPTGSRPKKSERKIASLSVRLPTPSCFACWAWRTLAASPPGSSRPSPNPATAPWRRGPGSSPKCGPKVWIEQATYHWVKMDAEAIDALTFGFGLLRVAPGGTLHFEQVRVNDEIWLPSRALIHGDARLALIKKLRAEIDIRYSGYRKFQSDSRLVEAREN